jgi:hypothetical protein
MHQVHDGGDSGGYFTHHWEAALFTVKGKKVRLKGTTFMASPLNFRVRTEISEGNDPFVNLAPSGCSGKERPGGNNNRRWRLSAANDHFGVLRPCVTFSSQSYRRSATCYHQLYLLFVHHHHPQATSLSSGARGHVPRFQPALSLSRRSSPSTVSRTTANEASHRHTCLHTCECVFPSSRIQ